MHARLAARLLRLGRPDGLTRNTEEGALLEFAAALDNAKPSHRLAAWFMLLAFVGPAILTLLMTIF